MVIGLYIHSVRGYPMAKCVMLKARKESWQAEKDVTGAGTALPSLLQLDPRLLDDLSQLGVFASDAAVLISDVIKDTSGVRQILLGIIEGATDPSQQIIDQRLSPPDLQDARPWRVGTAGVHVRP